MNFFLSTALLRLTVFALFVCATLTAVIPTPVVSCGDSWEDIILGERKPAAMERDFLQFVVQRMDETCFMIRSRDHEAAAAATEGIHNAFSFLAGKYGSTPPAWASSELDWPGGFKEICGKFAAMVDLSQKGDIIGSHVGFLSGKDRLISLFLGRDMLTPAWCLEDYRRTLKMLEGEIVKSGGGEFLAKAVSSCSKAVLLKERLNAEDLALAEKDLDDLISKGRQFIDWLCERDHSGTTGTGAAAVEAAGPDKGVAGAGKAFDTEVRDKFSVFVKSFHAVHQKLSDLGGVKATAAGIEGFPMKECCPAVEAIEKKETMEKK